MITTAILPLIMMWMRNRSKTTIVTSPKRVKNKEVDLLIVVGMFLTGFDAPTLNTLFVDKNLRLPCLIQAYSRTNRIYNSTQKFWQYRHFP